MKRYFTKEEIIKGAIAVIERIAKEKNLEINNRGTGHAYEGTVWKGILEDESGIPNVIAKSDEFRIELRSLWDSPEIVVRRKVYKGEELLVLTFNDQIADGSGNYVHTGKFRVGEVRVDSCTNYRKCVNEVYRLIKEVKQKGKENE